MEVLKKEKTVAEIVQLDVGFDQIWHLVQQLSIARQIDFLDKLQAELEAGKHIKPRINDEEEKSDEKEMLSTFKDGLKSAFKEIQQIKQGKKQGTSLNDFLNEL